MIMSSAKQSNEYGSNCLNEDKHFMQFSKADGPQKPEIQHDLIFDYGKMLAFR